MYKPQTAIRMPGPIP